MRYLLLFILLVFNQCSHNHHHNHANAHMNKMSFDEMVKHFESPERDKWQKPDVVLNKMGNLKGQTISEIGAGTGYFTFRLAEKAKLVIAADVDSRFLEYIENRKKSNPALAAKIQTLKIPFTSPDLPVRGFDKLLIVDVYHHIEDRTVYFTQLKSIMKNSAEIYIVDFKMGSPVGPPDKIKLTPETVKKELTKAGFNKIEIDNDSLPNQYIIKAKI